MKIKIRNHRLYVLGTVAGRHLKLVMSKLESIYRAHATKKKTSALFFGLLRDRSGEEQQVGNTSGVHFCGI
jgi:hypothetical protein